MGREHGYALHAQGSAVHDVVVVALHGDELSVAYGGDHAAATRAKIARGCELSDVRELQLLIRSPYRRQVEKAAECQTDASANSDLQPISTIDGRRIRCS